jgi:hypothetical protein
MKIGTGEKMIKYIIGILFLSCCLLADCDNATIKEVNGEYIYSKDCHKEVGKNIRDIKLKDLIIEKQEQRIELWSNKTYELEKEINSLERWKEVNKWIYYGLGAVSVGLSVYLAGKIYK